MLESIFFAFWFFLPAGLANMVPVFAARLPWLKNLEFPMDFFCEFRGKRVFGSHKTFRGLVSGIVVSVLVVWLQKVLYMEYESLRPWVFDYSTIQPLLLGGLLGFGALGGDAIKSFFKRQVGIASGKSWLVFDQVDYIVGGLFAASIYAPLPMDQYLYILVLYVGLHFLVNLIGYGLGFKDSPL